MALSLDGRPNGLVYEVVDANGFVVQALGLEHVTELFQQEGVLEAEAEGSLKREGRLVEALLSVLEAEDGV